VRIGVVCCSAFLRRILCCSLFFVPPPTYASDATGSVKFASCDSPLRYSLELTRIQKKTLRKALVFRIPDLGFLANEKDWMEVPGVECKTPDQCETAVSSKIQIMRVSHRWGNLRRVSGNFVVAFKDGRKLEGSFSAKEIRPLTRIICE
jgi:hypothetical protein